MSSYLEAYGANEEQRQKRIRLIKNVSISLACALIVGLISAFSIAVYPELEILATYVIVIAVLLFWPSGLFGRRAA